MKSNPMTSDQLITASYGSYRHSVYLYIFHRIEHREEAEDLTQDVFLRLMDYKQMLRPDTVRSFIYTIARNLVNDYLRRYYRRQEYTSYIYDTCPEASDMAESAIVARDLASLEMRVLHTLPKRRRQIYVMTRFEEKSVPDIADALHLSCRTVENHLLMGRKAVRAYIKQCI